MQKIQASEALAALKAGEVLISLANDQQHYFALVSGRVRVKTVNSRYTLSLEEWMKLFDEPEFWLYEPENGAEISTEKDEEYYSWTHK